MNSSLQSLTDHLGRTVVGPVSPKRIISLCPSITETLFSLGLGEKVVGRTRFCIHPAQEVAPVMRVGGTKSVNMQRIHDLNPDLIIAEKEENTPEMVAALEKKYPVIVTDVVDVNSALDMILLVGRACGVGEEAEEMVASIKRGFTTLDMLPQALSVLYLIWQEPVMVVSQDTFIHDLLARNGFNNLGLRKPGRYPTLSAAELQNLRPEVVLLSSEPYPFKDPHIEKYRKIFPQAHVQLVDGELFSWYGSRMLHMPAYFRQLRESIKMLGKHKLSEPSEQGLESTGPQDSA